MSQQLIDISAAEDGSVWGLAPGGAIVQVVPAPVAWTPISGQQLTSISATPDGALTGINTTGQIVQSTNGTTFQGLSTQLNNAAQISASDATTIWSLDAGGNVYAYSGSSWIYIGAGTAFIAAAADGSLWGITTSGSIQRYDVTNKVWQPVGGAPETLTALAIAGDWVWGIGSTGAVYEYDGADQAWTTLGGATPSGIRSVACGDDSTVFIVDGSGAAYQYDLMAQGWNPLPPPTSGSLQQVSAGNASNIWGIDTNHAVYRFSIGDGAWQPVQDGKPLSQISVGSANNVWGVDSTGAVWQNTSPTSWSPQRVNGSLSMVSVASDETVWGLQSGSVLEYASASGTWNPMSCPVPLSQVSVASAGNVWGAAATGAIYQYTSDSGWQKIDGNLASISAAADGSVWGLDISGNAYAYLGPPAGWYQLPNTYLQISAGRNSDIWGIDYGGNAVVINRGQSDMSEGPSTIVFSPKVKRWDTEDPFNEAQSTHLWIVNRGAALARQQGALGQQVEALVKPFQGNIGDLFHDNLCQGVYGADFLPEFNNPNFITATYASHFYDPATGKNYEDQTSPTALTMGRSLFWDSVNAYLSGDMKAAGFSLGVSLHYLTDLTQPMHAGNFTFMSSYKMGYHIAYEALALRLQNSVTPPATYKPSNLGADPDDYLIAAAVNSKNKYYATICAPSITEHYGGSYGMTKSQEKTVGRTIAPTLQDAINIVSQYLVAWMAVISRDLASSTIVSESSGMVVDVAHGATTAGSPLQQYTWDYTTAQQWVLSQLTGDDAGYYKLVAFNNMVMDVRNQSTAASAQIVINTWSNTESQKWNLVSNKKGTVSIQNKNSGLYLTVPGASVTARTLLVQDENKAGAYWIATPSGATSIALFDGDTDFVLDIQNAATNPGAGVQLYKPNATNAQQFLWVPLAGDDAGSYIILAGPSGLALQGLGAGKQVIQSAYDPTNDTMKWLHAPAPNVMVIPTAGVPSVGPVVIRNKGTGLYMYVNGSAASGATIVSGALTQTTPNAKWVIGRSQQ